MLLTAIKVTATVSVYCVPGPVVRVLPFQTPVRSSFTFVCLGLLSTHLHCLFSIINVESRGNFLTVQWLGLRQRSQKEKKKKNVCKKSFPFHTFRRSEMPVYLSSRGNYILCCL